MMNMVHAKKTRWNLFAVRKHEGKTNLATNVSKMNINDSTPIKYVVPWLLSDEIHAVLSYAIFSAQECFFFLFFAHFIH